MTRCSDVPGSRHSPRPTSPILGRPRFRQILDPESRAYTYLLGDPITREAVAIDAVPTRTALPLLAMLAELDLRLVHLLLTHAHGGLPASLRQLARCTGATVVASEAGPPGVDLRVCDGDRVTFGMEALDVIGTPGHTPGCVSYLWRDRVFTGDALLIGRESGGDEPDADPAALYDSLARGLLSLPGETLVFPGHATGERTVSTIAEERASNPDLAGLSRDEFITRRRNTGSKRASAPQEPGT